MNLNRHYGKYFIWIGLLVLGTVSIPAARGNAEIWNGFSGYIQPMVGVASVKSASSVGDDNARIDALDQEGKSETIIVPMLEWNAGYGFAEERARIWAGSSEDTASEGGGLLELGASYTLGDGSRILLAYTPPVLNGDVWEDPFLVGRNRVETDMTSQGIRVGVESVFGLPLSLSYNYTIEDIDQDRAGTSLSSLSAGDRERLKRSGKNHQADIRYDIDLGHGFALQPGVNFTRGEADGAANRFDQYGCAIALGYTLNKASFSVATVVGRSEYDERHPVFGKTREDDIYGLNLGMNYRAPFNVESLSLVLYTVFSRRDSNIKFYDERVLMSGFGVNWAF